MRVVQAVKCGDIGCTRLEQRLQLCILQRGEIQTLVRVEAHSLRDDAELHRLKVFGALGHDDNVGTILTI